MNTAFVFYQLRTLGYTLIYAGKSYEFHALEGIRGFCKRRSIGVRFMYY